MDEKNFQEYVVHTLKELVNRQDNVERSIQDLREGLNATNTNLLQFREETGANIQELREGLNATNTNLLQFREETGANIQELREVSNTTNTNLLQFREETGASIQQLKSDIKRVDKKVDRLNTKADKILEYVEYIDSDLQKHKKAELV